MAKAALPDFTAMSIEELQEVAGAVASALDDKKNTRRQELLAELEKLGGVPSAPRRGRTPTAVGEPSAQRASPKPQYRAPGGQEWTGRGAIPRFFKELGVTSKEQLEEYRIKE